MFYFLSAELPFTKPTFVTFCHLTLVTIIDGSCDLRYRSPAIYNSINVAML